MQRIVIATENLSDSDWSALAPMWLAPVRDFVLRYHVNEYRGITGNWGEVLPE